MDYIQWAKGFVFQHRRWLVLSPIENPSKYIKALITKGFQPNDDFAFSSVIKP
jgi:hypothetical protein